jgi:hypothetical protein
VIPANPLFAAEVAFGCLNRDVAHQELESGSPSFVFGFLALADLLGPCLPIAQPPPSRLHKAFRPRADWSAFTVNFI